MLLEPGTAVALYLSVMTLTRILVALNTPNGRDAAFERALALAKTSGAELYLLHAVPANRPFSFRAAERLERTAELRRRAEEAGVRVEAVEQHGDAADLIEIHATARAVDLIVIGGDAPRGWGHPRSVVAERVIRKTTVPTLVVAGDGAGTAAAFRNVLAAVDLSAGSKDVVSGAIGLTAPGAARLTVFHAVTGLEAANPVSTRAHWMVPEYRNHVLSSAQRTLHAMVSEMPRSIATRVRVSGGTPAGTILEKAAETGADLIVMGRSGTRKLLGSTALRVLRRNDRSLLLIPPGAAHRVNQMDHARGLKKTLEGGARPWPDGHPVRQLDRLPGTDSAVAGTAA